jgi:formylglycine-generating enzyme required for sulfatase activity
MNAALNVLDGTIIGRNMQNHRYHAFIRFLNAIETQVHAQRNPSHHRHPRNPQASEGAQMTYLPSPLDVPLHKLFLAVFLAALALTASSLGHTQVRKDREFRECPDCPLMVGIPAGTFLMGSPKSEPGRFDSEGPQHVVSIKAFALGKYDVASDQFLTFLRHTGYEGARGLGEASNVKQIVSQMPRPENDHMP